MELVADLHSLNLEMHLVLFSALDQIEVHLRNAVQAYSRGETKAPESFLGILSPALIDLVEHNVYGFITATKVKMMAVVRENACKQRKDEETIMRSMFKQCHSLYIEAASSPFFTGLDTKSFISKLTQVVDQHAQRFI